MPRMLKIAIPKNMLDSVSEHFKLSDHELSYSDRTETGVLAPHNDMIRGFRSADIPPVVANSIHVGICGSDWLNEHELRGLFLEQLGTYRYGRYLYTKPTLELIVRRNQPASKPEDLMPGDIIITEYPNLTSKFLGGLGLKVVDQEKEQDAPRVPYQFSLWCRELGVIGTRTVHGSIAASVIEDGGFGIMVNEKGNTMRDYGLKTLGTVHEIFVHLVADGAVCYNTVLTGEIDRLRRDLDSGYSIMELEQQSVPEVNLTQSPKTRRL